MEKYLSKDAAYNVLKEHFDKANNKNYVDIPWIMVHVLRVLIEDYDKIAKVSYSDLDKMVEAALRYFNGESLSDIFGNIEFYGRMFDTTHDVFDPRLSTEALINAVVHNINPKDDNYYILDLCTGTGCVAITLEKIMMCFVMGVDISQKAIEVARQNAIKHSSEARFINMDLKQDWSKYLDQKFNCIVSNPPYWRSEKVFDASNNSIIKHNPIKGFNGGKSGLDFHKLIINTSPKYLEKGGYLFLEMDEEQEDVLRELLSKDFENIKTEKDYRGINRVIYGRLK